MNTQLPVLKLDNIIRPVTIHINFYGTNQMFANIISQESLFVHKIFEKLIQNTA